jgi:hypothetical protein
MQYESIHELGQHLLRRELEVAGDERRRSQARVPLFARAGRAGGLPMVEVARSTGLSRKGAYDAIEREIDDDHDRTWGLDIALMALLAVKGPLTVEMADAALRAGPTDVWRQLEKLVNEGVAHRLVGGKGTSPHYAVDEDVATQAMMRRLEDIRGVRADGYSVYYAVSPHEIHSIERAVGETVRTDEWNLIRLGNNSVATTDELALIVRAPDRRTALETAEELWQLIAERADLRRAAVITQIIDPTHKRLAA